MPKIINPSYSHRYTPDDIWRFYNHDAEAAFAAGDFMLAAEYAGDPELKGCALILGGLPHKGRDLLLQIHPRNPLALLCLAYGHWTLGDNEAALETLKGVAEGEFGDMAQRLRSLITATRIPVFLITAHLPIFTKRDSTASAAEHRYGAFDVKYVGSQLEHNAYEYGPTEPFDDFIDRLAPEDRPAFIFAPTPQWILPKNLGQVRVPKVMWSHDADSFLYRAFDNFRLFDIQIVMTAHEHFELSRITGEYCVSNVMSNTLCECFPDSDIGSHNRDIDVFFSGSALRTWHTEKARFLFQLADLAETHHLCILDGHIAEADYLNLLRRAKTVPIVGRHAGNASPRWRDSLSKGVCLLYPQGTGYGTISPACLAYDPGNISRSIADCITTRPDDTDRARAFKTVDEQFSISRVSRDQNFERLLKYVAFLALVWRKEHHTPERRPQRRLVWLTPWIDCSIFGFEIVVPRIRKIMENVTEAECKDPRDFNDAAQLGEHLARLRRNAANEPLFKRARDSWIKKGLARFPNSLLLRFNEAYFSFFDRQKGHSAARALFDALIVDFSTLTFDAVGSDVAGGMLHTGDDPVFPHYEYAHLVLQRTIQTGPAGANKDAAQVLLAACYGFLGVLNVRDKLHQEGFAQINRSLAIFADNVPLLTTRFYLCIEQVLEERFGNTASMEHCVDAFYDLAQRYPTVLLTHIGIVVRILGMLDRHEQLAATLAQWYPFASSTYLSRTDSEWLSEFEQATEIVKHEEDLPQSVRSKLASWRSGSKPVRGCSQIDLLLCAAARRKSPAWVQLQRNLPLVPIKWAQGTAAAAGARKNLFGFFKTTLDHSENPAILRIRIVAHKCIGPKTRGKIYAAISRLASRNEPMIAIKRRVRQWVLVAFRAVLMIWHAIRWITNRCFDFIPTRIRVKIKQLWYQASGEDQTIQVAMDARAEMSGMISSAQMENILRAVMGENDLSEDSEAGAILARYSQEFLACVDFDEKKAFAYTVLGERLASEGHLQSASIAFVMATNLKTRFRRAEDGLRRVRAALHS